MPIEQISWSAAAPVEELWRQMARSTRDWLQRHDLAVRDAVVLVPFAALMAPARAAWAECGGWQPRIETPLTLAAALGPPQAVPAGSISGDTTLDTLTASQMLRRQPWGAAWLQRDPAGFGLVVDAVVQAAQSLREAALAVPPDQRDAHWLRAREHLPAPNGPAATESALLAVAFEWAAGSTTAATDRLYAHRPSAWIALQLGGAMPLAEALLAHADGPALRLWADPPADEPYGAVAQSAQLERVICDHFEAEAQAAASQVLSALNEGRAPVALVALDREVVRRVRALLERAQVPLVDETGWLLSTTRAAAAVLALLRAAAPHASHDTRLDWLKTWPPARPAALDALEAQWRGRRALPGRAEGEALWQAAAAHLQPLAQAGEPTLAEWLDLLGERLESSGSFERLSDDAAGSQVLAALGWPGGASWSPMAHSVRMDLAGFTAWVERTLQQQPYLPLPDSGAQVVLTPLARAFGRPFGQIVIPGADHLRLGSTAPPPSLIGEALAEVLGLPTRASRRQAQRLALAQVLRAPRVTLLRRRRDGDEPLAESPDVEWLLLARSQHLDQPAWPLHEWRPALRAVPLAGQPPPMPTAAQALPGRLSASRLEALRDCPYRFFSRAVLRLDELEEIETELAKRDYGSWLHEVLHHFHSQRVAGADDAAALRAAAEAVTAQQQLDAAELLPFRASFENLIPAYLDWLAAREQAGWNWSSGEQDHECSLPDMPGLLLHGRIDRLDSGPAGRSQLLDYKTGSTEGLKRRVRQPLEDTQLPFYAALLGAPPTLGAAYLSLDDAKAPTDVEHPDVHDTAQQLMQGLAGEWRRLQQGAALPALGEGAVCETCEARGLCRRDHWGAA